LMMMLAYEMKKRTRLTSIRMHWISYNVIAPTQHPEAIRITTNKKKQTITDINEAIMTTYTPYISSISSYATINLGSGL